MDKAKAQLNKDRALAQKAERDLKRIRPLYAQNAASQLDLDNATAAYERDGQRADERSRPDAGGHGAGLYHRTVAHHGVISAPATPTSEPSWGRAASRCWRPSSRDDTVRVDFSMTGMDYLRSKERNVNLGQKDSTRRWNPYITVTLPDNSRYPLRGLVDFADPQVDPETGTFSVRAEMPNPDHILLPGQFTKVKLLLDVRENAVVVPSKAIVIEKAVPTSSSCGPTASSKNVLSRRGPSWTTRRWSNAVCSPANGSSWEGYHKLNHGMRVEAVEPWRDNGVASTNDSL